MRSPDGYFSVYFRSCEATGAINNNVTLEWAHKQLVTRLHTLFYFLHDIIWDYYSSLKYNESKDDDKNDDLHTSTPCLTRLVYILPVTSQPIADDVTMIKQLWRNHVNNDI